MWKILFTDIITMKQPVKRNDDPLSSLPVGTIHRISLMAAMPLFLLFLSHKKYEFTHPFSEYDFRM